MRELYADVIVDISHEKLDKAFQYRVPESLRGALETGMCVTVPFGGGNKPVKGYVVDLGEVCKFDPDRTKDILDIAANGVGVEDKMIALAAWIRKNYGSTMIQALKTVLPAKQSVKRLEHRTLQRIMSWGRAGERSRWQRNVSCRSLRIRRPFPMNGSRQSSASPRRP